MNANQLIASGEIPFERAFTGVITAYTKATLDEVNNNPERHPIAHYFDPRLFEGEWRALYESVPIGVRSNITVTPRIMGRYATLISELGRESAASRATGVNELTIRFVRSKCPGFDDACYDALDEFRDRLHAEAYKRAVDGWDEPVFYQGVQCGYIRRKSDRILELMLKAHIPDQFRDRVDVNANVSGGVLVAPAGLTAGDWAAQFGALDPGGVRAKQPEPVVIEHQPAQSRRG